MNKKNTNRNIFPKWANTLPLYILLGLGLIATSVVFIFWYWFSPKNLEVGYEPKQPIPFSHKLHAGDLGIDCRYCHTNVEISQHSTVPDTETCMNCHKFVKKDSPSILKIKESLTSNTPIEWIKVHRLPDYVYFDHSRHVNSGISCVSCHGRVDQQKTIRQVEPLSMSWCLECHRAPEKHLRPKSQITNLGWKAENQIEMGKKIKADYHINPGEDCSVCHR